jgi:hypothetical protein
MRDRTKAQNEQVHLQSVASLQYLPGRYTEADFEFNVCGGWHIGDYQLLKLLLSSQFSFPPHFGQVSGC